MALLALWVACYDRRAAFYYEGRWNDWQLSFARGQIGFLFRPGPGVPRAGELGSRRVGTVFIEIDRSTPRTFGFHALGISLSYLRKGEIIGDTVVRPHTFLGIPYWLLLACLLLNRWMARRRRQRQKVVAGFEVQKPASSQ
jgi:hypothetical protein